MQLLVYLFVLVSMLTMGELVHTTLIRDTVSNPGITGHKSTGPHLPTSFLPQESDENLLMGNPSGAATNRNQPTNYLIVKRVFALSYNRNLGTPNWVSWHLDRSWLGTLPRIGSFFPDSNLPIELRPISPEDYTGSGFDRGQMCPEKHRSRNTDSATSTHVMTNIIPLAADVNRRALKALQSYELNLVSQGKELYIVSGGVGSLATIAGGRITVPEKIWQVVLVLPSGDNDLSRVSATTRTIAVIIPNKNGISANWRSFRVKVNDVEALTGLDFFSNISVPIQQAIQSRVDHG